MASLRDSQRLPGFAICRASGLGENSLKVRWCGWRAKWSFDFAAASHSRSSYFAQDDRIVYWARGFLDAGYFGVGDFFTIFGYAFVEGFSDLLAVGRAL